MAALGVLLVGEVAAEIDRLVKQSIDRAHGTALAVLKLNRELLETMAQRLLADEVLEGDDLKNSAGSGSGICEYSNLAGNGGRLLRRRAF